MRRLVIAILVPLLFIPASADDLHDRFDKAVKLLRSDDPAERDKGSAELEAIAREAPELVLPLANDADPEVKNRTLLVLQRLKDADAAALFRKVELKYADSKTVQYKVTMSGRGGRLKISLNVHARTGNLFRFEGTETLDSNDFKEMAVCNGKLLLVQREGFPPGYPEKALERVSDLMRGGMIRYGMWNMIDCIRCDTLATMSEEFPVDDFKSELDEYAEGRRVTVISYSVMRAGYGGSKGRQKLWIDAESLTILKRELTVDSDVTITETYSDAKFDEEIPDDKFALPKETEEK